MNFERVECRKITNVYFVAKRTLSFEDYFFFHKTIYCVDYFMQGSLLSLVKDESFYLVLKIFSFIYI